MTFGERLKTVRTKSGVTQVEVAKMLGVGQSAIAKLENGINRPSDGMLVALADYFGVTTDYLLGRE